MPVNLTGSTIAATYSQLLHVDSGPTSTEKVVYSGTGVATSLKLGTQSMSVDNIRLDGNIISTLDTNGNLTLAPNGTGSVAIGKIACTGGSITGITDLAIADGGTGASTDAGARSNLGLGSLAVQNSNAVSITGGSISNVSFTGSFSGMTLVEATTLATSNATTGVNLNDNTLAADGTDTNIDINITPKGTGEVNITKVDIDGGSIDGTPIGASSVSTVKGTTVLATVGAGYTTGAGGTVTQATNKSTGVTLNQACGQITMNGAQLNRNTGVTFTLTNSEIAATDVVIVNIASGATANSYTVGVDEVSAGSCEIHLHNHTTGTDLSDTVVLNFVVIKGVHT
jgi:hypothetical protein